MIWFYLVIGGGCKVTNSLAIILDTRGQSTDHRQPIKVIRP
jgi:hypothetical protein